MSVNKVILVGHVGKDPEIRYFDKDVSVANFSLATTEKGYTAQNGTQVPDRTEWHNIIAWRGLAKLAEKYIRKGSQLYIDGKIQSRTWEKDGVKHYITEIYADTIQLLDKRSESNETSVVADQMPKAVEPPPHVEDDLPF
jgi:single-strand DNA-binding protein